MVFDVVSHDLIKHRPTGFIEHGLIGFIFVRDMYLAHRDAALIRRLRPEPDVCSTSELVSVIYLSIGWCGFRCLRDAVATPPQHLSP